MPKYRANVFVQHEKDKPHGCKLAVVVDARTRDGAIVAAMAEAVKLCMEHHPEIQPQPWAPHIEQLVEMKEIKS